MANPPFSQKKFLTKKYYYQVNTAFIFDSVGKKEQVTYYGSDKPLTEYEVRKLAIKHINEKLERSSGRLTKLKISNVSI